MSQDIINWVGGAIIAVLSWIGRILWESLTDQKNDLKELTKKVNSIETLVVGDYVKKDYFESKVDVLFCKFDSLKDNMNERLDDIRDRLDDKADK